MAEFSLIKPDGSAHYCAVTLDFLLQSGVHGGIGVREEVREEVLFTVTGKLHTAH